MHDPRSEGWRPGGRGHGRGQRPRGSRPSGPGGGGSGPSGFGFGGPGGTGGGAGFGGPGGPGGPGFGPGSDPAAGSQRRGGRGRVLGGDVRAAVLLLLAEQPMHGYQLMQAVAERSGGRWTPSPGAIYPTLSQLEDEGLVTVTADAGRKLATLTDAGRSAVEELRGTGNDPFGGGTAGAPTADLRGLLDQLHGAVRQVARTGTEAQLTAAAGVLAEARRALYLLLAEGPDGTPHAGTPETPQA
ncbi:PadR family transcriptional regulator [Geodermatophilus arenarius]|uniref:PadR family transcriptional regulator n=1 Tax=Geodermatophilus arenarius TaxID=1137990 RepID=A0ABV9LI12_9ACTN